MLEGRAFESRGYKLREDARAQRFATMYCRAGATDCEITIHLAQVNAETPLVNRDTVLRLAEFERRHATRLQDH